ncbi:MAG: PTS sugar transporter subunit IIA [Desulfomicrobium sp.]|jgi:PTS system nitrogen regulatory IIA component|nr:PTS sugar transporter subunit IIA [Desulfomicrobium sp.]NLV97244.1 PTS sugar transporter subunit IIA [Desulfovibrionales bacterium]
MKLADYLDQDLIVANLEARTKPEVLAELVASVSVKYPQMDTARIIQTLIEREALGTTGIGDGVAIPHGKLDDLKQVVIVVGRSQKGVDFDSLDHQPATIFFTVLAPSNVVGLHLKILASISRLLKDDGFRQAFVSSTSQDELWQLLQTV